jgi:hypothetical protein
MDVIAAGVTTYTIGISLLGLVLNILIWEIIPELETFLKKIE